MVKSIAVVTVLILVSALAVIDMRHRNRQLFVELQSLLSAHDQLNIEWDQLLLEQGAWSEHRRIESLARTRLGMAAPRADQIVIVNSPSTRRE